ncbi:hypothetical protein [Pseudooceanicola sp. MF1-13]|uniref:hypothetical protein n=1 Tax=Pseudooceanicola sp. MF1-13 TaxID=3379095 RepID=UPI00389204D3
MHTDASREAADQVHDLASFLVFLDCLFQDWQIASAGAKPTATNPNATLDGWENVTIGTFLEAAIAGARDNKVGEPGGYLADTNPWRQAAEIILLGKVYE